MPYRAGVDGPPNTSVTGTWPQGHAVTIEAGYAQDLARNLRDAIGDASLRSVAKRCGIHHTTLSAILTGERWADLVTIARLESGLEVSLWPHR